MDNVDTLRARFAYTAVKGFRGQPDAAVAYRNELRSAGMLVHQIGLLQALAFYGQKGDDRALVRDQLLHWLVSECPLTRHRGDDARTLATANARYDHLLQSDSVRLRHVTDEALKLINWLKRFAEGRWDDHGAERPELRPSRGG